MRNLIAVLVLMLAMAVVAPVGAATLYMETTVSRVEDNGNVTFTDRSGDFFFFTKVSDKFKVRDEVELEVTAVFDGENFVVKDMKYIIPEITVKFPETKRELYTMYGAIIGLMLASFAGGFLLAYKPKKNRRIYHGNS